MPPFSVFQVAYATGDIDRAAEFFSARFGIPCFRVSRNVRIQTTSGDANCHFALAQIGGVQLELIEPAGGSDAVYRDLIGTNQAVNTIRLHHFGCLIRDAAAWREVVSEIRTEGFATPVCGDFGGMMHYLYADTRDSLGHYLEYMYQTDAGAHLFDDVPRYD